MSYSCWQRPLQVNLKWQADVVIVGAGITGLSLAWWLKYYQPNMKVVILERDGVAAGASGRNAGFHTAGSAAYLAQLVQASGAQKASRLWLFKRQSLELMQKKLLSQFPETLNTSKGSITFYRELKLWEEHSFLLAQVVGHGFRPFSSTPWECYGAYIFENDRQLHPVQLLDSMALQLQSVGVTIVHSDMGWIEDAQNRLCLHGSRGDVECAQVFLALNGYVSEFYPELKVQPKRAQMVALKVPDAFPHGNFYDPVNKVYFRFDSRHQVLLVGGMRLIDEQRENTVADQVTATVQMALENYGKSLTQVDAVLARWSGVMGFTEHGQPLIQDLNHNPRTTFVGGYSGHGMGLAFGIAHEAVLRFLGRPTGHLDLLGR